MLQGHKVLFATSMVSMVLGSIHAFSIFVIPLETKFASSRASVSLIYSLSLVFLTIAVLFGPAIYSRLRPATIYLCVACLGTAGALIAGFAERIEVVWLGYGFAFGTANGLGYGFGLQYAARANPDQPGFAMAVVAAAYALGSILAPYGFETALSSGGIYSAMLTLGAAVFIVATSASALAASSGAQYSINSVETAESDLQWIRIATIWIAYGSGVAAGLMAIGHAAGIAATAGFATWVAAAVIAGCNLVGSLLVGWLSDRVTHRSILTILPVLGSTALIALCVWADQAVMFLGLVGFAYGGTIAAYPAAIAILYPGDDGPRVYGRIFTAWGVAGLLAPWFAGQIYDQTGNYSSALLIASGFGIVSAITAHKVFRQCQ